MTGALINKYIINCDDWSTHYERNFKSNVSLQKIYGDMCTSNV